MEEALTFECVMFRALTRGASIRQILEEAYGHLGNPLSASSYLLEPLGNAAGADVPTDEVWNMLTSSEMTEHYRLETLMHSHGASEMDKHAKIYELPNMDVRMMGCAGFTGQKAVIYTVMLEHDRSFQEGDALNIEVLARALAFAFSYVPEARSVSTDNASSVISRLIKGDSIAREVVERAGLRNDEGMRFCVAVLDAPEDMTRSLLPAHALSMIQGDYPHSKVALIDGRGVVVFCAASEKLTPTELFAVLDPLMEKRNSRCGVSLTFGNIMRLRESYMQALWSLETNVYTLPGERVSFYGDKSFYHMLEEVEDGFDLRRLMDPYVSYLLRYDREHGTSWLRHYAIYTFCDRDMKQTAEAMGVHPSTAKYRIARLREMAAGGFNSPGRPFLSELSLRVLFVMEPDLQLSYDIPQPLLYRSRLVDERDT